MSSLHVCKVNIHIVNNKLSIRIPRRSLNLQYFFQFFLKSKENLRIYNIIYTTTLLFFTLSNNTSQSHVIKMPMIKLTVKIKVLRGSFIKFFDEVRLPQMRIEKEDGPNKFTISCHLYFVVTTRFSVSLEELVRH